MNFSTKSGVVFSFLTFNPSCLALYALECLVKVPPYHTFSDTCLLSSLSPFMPCISHTTRLLRFLQDQNMEDINPQRLECLTFKSGVSAQPSWASSLIMPHSSGHWCSMCPLLDLINNPNILEGTVRGTPKSSAASQSSTASATLPSLRSALPCCSALPSCCTALLCASNHTGLYMPPHCWSWGPWGPFYLWFHFYLLLLHHAIPHALVLSFICTFTSTGSPSFPLWIPC